LLQWVQHLVSGWVVFVVWFVIFVSAMRYFILVFTFVMSRLLLAICYKKGVPPRWRWGDRDE